MEKNFSRIHLIEREIEEKEQKMRNIKRENANLANEFDKLWKEKNK